jgi:hypothetical protein
MKRVIWLWLVLSTCTSYSQSTTSEQQTLAGPFDWSSEAEALGGMNGRPLSAWIGEIHHLCLQTEAQTPSVYALCTLGPAIVSRVTAPRYAIVGSVQYSNVARGTFLEMENWFAPVQSGGQETCYYSRTLADSGPMSKLEGLDDDHEFALPFDSTGARTPLVRLVIRLHLAGPGHLIFSNVRLVQYPAPASISPLDARQPAAAQPATSVLVPLEWRSFAAGVLSTVLIILGFAVLLTLVRWLHRVRHARELRRMASLDG